MTVRLANKGRVNMVRAFWIYRREGFSAERSSFFVMQYLTISWRVYNMTAMYMRLYYAMTSHVINFAIGFLPFFSGQTPSDSNGV